MDKTAQQWMNEANASIERAYQVLNVSALNRDAVATRELALAQAQLLAAATAQLMEVTKVVRDGLTRIAETLRTKEA